MQTNGYWQGLLVGGWDEGVKFNRARNLPKALEDATPEDVVAAARRYLAPERMLRISAGS